MTSEPRSTGRFEVNEPHVVAEIVDGEVVVVDLRSGYYYSMCRMAAFIWKALAAGRTPAEASRAAAASCQDPPQDLEAVCLAFADKLVSEGLIRPSLQTASPGPLPSVTVKEPYLPPVFEKFTDMKEFLLVDPIHEVNVRGWPHKTEDSSAGSSDKDKDGKK